MKLKFVKKQKVIKNDNDELVVKNYPKNKQPIQQQPICNNNQIVLVARIIIV